jgi:hypothetical protein
VANPRWTPFPSCPIAGRMGGWLRFRQRRRPCRNRLAASLSKQIAAAVWPIPKSYPHRRVVASVRHSSCLTIDAGALQALRQRGTQQNVVATQTANATRSNSWRRLADERPAPTPSLSGFAIVVCPPRVSQFESLCSTSHFPFTTTLCCTLEAPTYPWVITGDVAVGPRYTSRA